ncbi:MAG: hypothetical protein SV186_00965 [Candidatus Nanohaloarchaea archaeon]|nr:hypothetical protein [Candidatus Nanohaloarchaea archaeon]
MSEGVSMTDIDVDELDDQPEVKELRIYKPGGQSRTAGKRAVRKINRENDEVTVMGMKPGICAWYSVYDNEEDDSTNFLRVLPWERVIDVLAERED